MKKNLHLNFRYISRSFLAYAIFLSVSCLTKTQLADETYDLLHLVTPDQTLNVRSQVQYLGSVIVDRAGQAEDQQALPLDVRARFEFDQRISSGSVVSPQAIRYFENAEASIKAGTGRAESKLATSNQLVLARMKSDSGGSHHFQIASLDGMLSQKEYELLKNPGDPLAFTDLFQKKGVKVGDKWNIGKEQFISLLSINRVISHSVNMMLKSVDDNIAKVYVYGKVKGEVDDVITELKIKGIAQLDLEKQLVVGFRMSIDEQRRAGQLAPGFEGQVKLESQIKPTSGNIMMSKDRLAKAHKGKKVKFSFQFDRDESDFKLIHSNDWRIIASEDEAVILRYISDGQMIAQCNVVQLPKRPEDAPLKLSEFQDEVRKIINKSEARIIDAEQFNTVAGDLALKIEVEGVEEGIPFSWLYYHVGADDGRRVTFVFTLEKDSQDYLQMADRALVGNIIFKSARQAKAIVTGTPNRK